MGRRLRWRAAAGAALLMCVAAQPAAQDPFVPFEPFDEASRVPELFAVRSALTTAILRHDAATVGRFLAPDFNSASGGRDGWLAEFRKARAFLLPIVTVLQMGGGFVGGSEQRFCAPYWYARDVMSLPFPKDFVISEGVPWIVLWPKAPVYSKPDRTSEILGRVGFQLVRPLRPAEEYEAPMMAISFGARNGYVDRQALQDADDGAHACFERRDGNWLLTTFSSY